MELMTNSEAYNFIVSIISRLSTDGFNINIGNFNNITFQDLDKDVGHFWLADTKIYNISFNKKLLAKNKLNFLKCAVYHELAHAIQHNEAFDANIIKYDKSTDEIYSITDNRNLAKNTIFDIGCHTLLWTNIAKLMNSLYKLDPPVRAYLTDDYLNKFLEETIMQPLFKKKSLLIDKDISGYTIDDIEKAEEIIDSNTEVFSESQFKPDHSYRNIDLYKKEN